MKFRLTSPYGALEEFRQGRPHTGIDLAMESGTELHSISDGVITRVVDMGNVNLGKAVYVEFSNGMTGIYGHMSDTSMVYEGKVVKMGDLIGYSGNSGFSTGSHLHFQLLNENMEVVDPTPIIQQVADMQGKGVGQTLLDKYNDFADKVIGKEMGFLETLGHSIGEEFVELFYRGVEAFTLHLPEMMGVVTFIAAGIIMFGFKPRKVIVTYASLLGGAVLWLINASS